MVSKIPKEVTEILTQSPGRAVAWKKRRQLKNIYIYFFFVNFWEFANRVDEEIIARKR